MLTITNSPVVYENGAFRPATAADALGYVERYWVSVSDGLLCAAEKLNGDEVVYRMAGMTVDTAAPGADAFTLPDGTKLHTVG